MRFLEAFESVVLFLQGFQWLDEGRHPGQHKLGFISFSPGENLVLKVHTPRHPEHSWLLRKPVGLVFVHHNLWWTLSSVVARDPRRLTFASAGPAGRVPAFDA